MSVRNLIPVQAPPFREFCKRGRIVGGDYIGLEVEWRGVVVDFRETAKHFQRAFQHLLLAICCLVCHLRNRATASFPCSRLQLSVFPRRPLRALLALVAVCSYYVMFRIYWWLSNRLPCRTIAVNQSRLMMKTDYKHDQTL